MTRCKTCFIEMKRAEERGDRLRAAYLDGYRDGLAEAPPPTLEPGSPAS
jgi:hypothetical protein